MHGRGQDQASESPASAARAVDTQGASKARCSRCGVKPSLPRGRPPRRGQGAAWRLPPPGREAGQSGTQTGAEACQAAPRALAVVRLRAFLCTGGGGVGVVVRAVNDRGCGVRGGRAELTEGAGDAGARRGAGARRPALTDGAAGGQVSAPQGGVEGNRVARATLPGRLPARAWGCPRRTRAGAGAGPAAVTGDAADVGHLGGDEDGVHDGVGRKHDAQQDVEEAFCALYIGIDLGDVPCSAISGSAKDHRHDYAA